MKEYKLKIQGIHDFVIIFPDAISSLIAKGYQNKGKELTVGFHEIMPVKMVQYLLSVVNANRYADPQFRFSRILTDPLRKQQIYEIVQGQLQYMEINRDNCFKMLQLVESVNGEAGGKRRK